MGFGSYDESEQEQPKKDDEDKGIDMTNDIRNWRVSGDKFEGESKTELGDKETLFENL
jgi:hypothetical protein